jgi:MFS family permease
LEVGVTTNQWQIAFNHPSGSKLGLLNALQTTGILVGVLFVPYLADGMGRRATVLFGNAIIVRPSLLSKNDT